MRASPLLRLLLITTCTAIVSLAGERSTTPPHVVVQVCSGCHAQNGDAPSPDVPRLAGMNATYLKARLAQLRATPAPHRDELFHPGTLISSTSRDNPATARMAGIAKDLSSKDQQSAASWYASQTSPAFHNGAATPNPEASTLFQNGLPSQNVPACQTCHGPNGEGTARAPRLQGQHAEYLLARLTQFRLMQKGHDSEAAEPMPAIARALSPAQSTALVNYLAAVSAAPAHP